MDIEDIARRTVNKLSWREGIDISQYAMLEAKQIIEQALEEVAEYYQGDIADLEAEIEMFRDSLRDDL